VLIAGAAAGAALLALALRRLDPERIPQAAVLAAAFFVASLASVPLGPAAVHPIFNGLMGLVLGWAAVPALLVALVLQAVFFGHGGVLVLGVNLVNLAVPALLVALLLGPALRRSAAGRRGALLGAAAGAAGALLTGLMVSLSLAASGEALVPVARLALAAYLPLAGVEAAITAAAVGFLGRVAPEILSPDAEEPRA
jgi:cobalt/nickel transport system permease protein